MVAFGSKALKIKAVSDNNMVIAVAIESYKDRRRKLQWKRKKKSQKRKALSEYF